MNNPYRARPARSRVDHVPVSGYTAQNQNSWGAPAQSGIPSSNANPQPPPVLNQQQQQQQSQDPWNWGSDNANNGNDSWNWSVEQQPEHQHQQQQRHQLQQQQFIPTYPNNGQAVPNAVAETFYQNLNLNNRAGVIAQRNASGGNTPRSREPTPNLPDHYTNYGFNRQYPAPPPEPNSKSNFTHSDHAQWSKDQQSRSITSSQQKPPPIISSQKQQTPPLPLPSSANSYNWNNVDQQNVTPFQNNWPNHPGSTTGSGYWPDPNTVSAGQRVESVANQWQDQAAHPRHMPPPTVSAVNDTPNNERSIGRANPDLATPTSYSNQSNAPPNQWPNHNREGSMPNQWQVNQHFPPPNVVNPPLEQPGSMTSAHQWPQQTKVQQDAHENQWGPQAVEANEKYEQLIPRESDIGRIPANDWQQVQPPSFNFSSSTGSATFGSVSNIQNSIEVEEGQQPSAITSVSRSVTSDEASRVQPSGNKATIDGRQNRVDSLENNVPSDNSQNVHTPDNTGADFPIGELTGGFSQLNLNGKSEKPVEYPESSLEMHPSLYGIPQAVTGVSSGNMAENAAPENVSVLPSEHVSGLESIHPIEGPSNLPREHTPPQTYQPASGKATESVSQAGYDQWYNRTTVPTQPDNEWCSNDHPPPPKQWPAEQNVENYENIQQPSEFVNLEVVTPVLQDRQIYGSRDSINRETLDNDPKPTVSPPKEPANSRDFRQEINNIEVPVLQHPQQPLQVEQTPDNYEFASNDRNTFLETGELTDSHQEHEPTPPSQDDENDEVLNDIPFLREVPGQSSSSDSRRNDPTGQEQYAQTSIRVSDPRRNNPSGQEQNIQGRSILDRTERRDIPSGQERNVPLLPRGDSETLERRNDPSGRERSLPPQQSRNDPSGEEQRVQPPPQIISEPNEMREVPGRGNEIEEPVQQTDSGLRHIPGGASPNETVQMPDDRSDARVVTGSREVAAPPVPPMQDQAGDMRSKREEAVGASMGENQGVSGPPNRRDSYEDGDDEGSGNSGDESRERRRDSSTERRRYEYDRKERFYDRDRDYDEEYYYNRRRGGEYDRTYNSREDLDRREVPYRDDDRRHLNRDDLDRHGREEIDRRGRVKEVLNSRDGRRRVDDRRREKGDNPRLRERDAREFDPRYPRDRDYVDRERRRDDRRGGRYDEYDPREAYRRDYYDDPYGKNSRPSSRSSYNDRDRDYYSRARDPYYGYNGYPGYDFGANYNNNYYAYLENLSRTNPTAYAEWYRKYYASQHQQQQQVARGVASYPEDRASVHSGRSSCDERTTGEKRMLGDASQQEDSTAASSRLTPAKFFTSHVYGTFSIGSLLHVHASYPAEGGRAKVDILRVENLLGHDPVARELRTYPGPLIKQVGVTHKKTIIEYCEAKIKKAAAIEEIDDCASYVLLYQLMIMLIQQNGNVVGVDIATLLLKNKEMYPYGTNKQHSSTRRESVVSERSGGTGGDGGVRDTATPLDSNEATKQRKPLSVEGMTDEFRKTLLYGLVQDALDYAMEGGLWGHALFLASKLDKRTHASVMTRFANSLPAQDPLQTLYQLHSGRVPASVTCVADPKWDDWRPHLAMIISNTSANPEVNRRAITTLGDTLAARSNIHGAHFCYILAQIDFGPYSATNNKLVLIGSNHCKPYSEFATTEAIMLTEIYEYARNLSEPGFTLVDLQTFKFELAVKMVDCGLIEKALLYIEQIAVNIVNEPSKYKRSFIEEVHTLGDRIKYHDPVCKDSLEDAANLTWLNNLAEIVGKCQAGEIIQDSHVASDAQHYAVQSQDQPDVQPQKWNAVQQEYSNGPTSLMEVPTTDPQTNWQPLSLPSNVQDPYNSTNQNMEYAENSIDHTHYPQLQQKQDYWGQQTYTQQDYTAQDYGQPEWQQQQQQAQYQSEKSDVDNTQPQDKWSYELEKEEKPAVPEPQPTISMAPSSSKQYDPLEELDALETPKTANKSSAENKKSTADKTMEKKNTSGGGSSWIGGLFSKLTAKPKNQMILPDDSNPTIVWDPVGKKWMNKDEDGDGSTAPLAPPPKASDLGFRLPPAERAPQAHAIPSMQPGAPSEDPNSVNSSKVLTGSNMFKLQKGRSMRNNYIDVMNPSGTKNSGATSTIATPVTSPMAPIAASSPQYFIPAPVHDPNAPVDFLSPTSMVQPGENAPQGLSRWSSTSSLSREVQSYTMRDPRLLQRDKGPMMFNPTDMRDRSAKNTPRSRYPPR